MRLLLNDASRLVSWAEKIIGCHFFPDAVALGWGDDAIIRATVVYDRWTETDCAMHLASDGTRRWMTRQALAAAYFYPFVQNDRRRVTGLVEASNADALRLNLHMGWRKEGVMRAGARNGDDLIVLGMLRSECRFILKEHRGD